MIRRVCLVNPGSFKFAEISFRFYWIKQPSMDGLFLQEQG